jgi:uncharacterized membrane protein YdjX (TVP38/TMEM64 family)
MSDAPSAAEIVGQPAIGNLRRAGQTLVLGLVIAGIVAAWRWRDEFDPLTLTTLIRAHPAAPLVFLALHLVASLTFVFGVWWGLLWSALGSVIGAVAGFLLARYVHAGFFQRARWSRFTALLERAERGGWRTVTLIRLVPVIPHSLSNYALGLTRLRLGDYALGSLLGQLPLTVAAVDLGAAGERAMRGASDWLVPPLIGASALALTIVIPAMVRRRRGRGE